MIPDYQSIMLPLLELLKDGKVYQQSEIVETLAKKYGLTEEERDELIPSGTQRTFDNRIGWAKSYLKKAGLADSPKRAALSITELGKKVLRDKPSHIDRKFLMQFPSFVEFITPGQKEADPQVADPIVGGQDSRTPEEILSEAYQQIRKSLASELLGKVLTMSPGFFERLVVELLVKMGYGGSIEDAGRAMGKSGDEGIDGTIKEDRLGLDIIYIQAKRWGAATPVGRPELQKFVGALAGQGAKKGVFITTSSFTKDALEYAPRNETKIVLIDGKELSQLMVDYNIGCALQHVFEVKKIDNDYFGED